MINGASALAQALLAILPSRIGEMRLYELATFRPLDEIYEVLGAEAQAEVLVIHLEDAGRGPSTLRVWSPGQGLVQRGEDSLLLTIGQASRVEWATAGGSWVGWDEGAQVMIRGPGFEPREVENRACALRLA